ncbi:MAG: NAD-dependent epimerase/dehydratase family protein [Bacteroidetes bacterium]|nr:NAD-dependent epimerase/dehydratase family protein [Bacteroidota bacterium]
MSHQPTANSQRPTAKILVTGGAGFIGSNLVETLLEMESISIVRVLDNLATGHLNNIESFRQHPKFEFLEGDIRDFDTCKRACEGMDFVSHQAALSSVPRSIKDPITTNEVNIGGTLNMFLAAKEARIKKLVYAASSSTYGDSPYLPKREDVTGKPLSPYAVTKLVSELYADVFARLYEVDFIGLRYFNIFGPRQDPNGAYAAVIPLFMKAVLENTPPTINGDGNHSRDFTYVENAVQANIKAMFSKRKEASNEVYNIANGEQTTLLELFNILKELSNSELAPIFGPERPGDVKHSLADISKAMNYLGYEPKVKIREGLEKAFQWYKENQTYISTQALRKTQHKGLQNLRLNNKT